MKPTTQPALELEQAKRALQAMRQAKSLSEFEDCWKEVLRRIERCWNKARNHFGKSPKWQQWQAPYDRLRRTDPLLAYFVNARGADEHTVNEITTQSPSSIGISPAEGNSLFLERLTFESGRVEIQTPQPVRVDFVPARVSLVPVVNRGRTYPVPRTHLGTTVDPRDVVAISEHAIAFYEDALRKAATFFVK